MQLSRKEKNVRNYLIICFVIDVLYTIEIFRKSFFFYSSVRAIEFLEGTIITQLRREHRRFVQKIGARQRVKIVGTRANWKGRKKLRHARRRRGSDNTCLETIIY